MEKTVAPLSLLLKQRFAVAGFLRVKHRRKFSNDNGDHLSDRKGQGMEFNEVRPYQSGDDVRYIDWRLTAKHQKPYTKLYHEETGRPLFLVVDLQSSMRFGTRRQFKSVLAAKVAAFLSFLSLDKKERLGAFIIDDENIKRFRAFYSQSHVMQILKAVSQATYASGERKISLTDILRQVGQFAHKGETVFVISDFYHYDDNMKKALLTLSQKTEVVLINIYDPLEAELPDGIFQFTDKKHFLSVRTKPLKKMYREAFENHLNQVKRTGAHIPFMALSTEGDYSPFVKYIVKEGL